MAELTRRDFVGTGALLGAMLPLAGETAVAAVDEAQASLLSAADKPDQIIRRMMLGYQLTQIVYVAAKLTIADRLASGPQTVADLAAATHTHEDSLYRVLRALAGYGVFAEEEGRRFRLTPAAEFLRTGVPGSLRAAAEVRGEEWTWRAWGALIESVKTGKTGFDIVYGRNTFDWLAEHPAAAKLFDEFQAELTARTAAAVAAAYDFSAARVIADIGGGTGTLLATVLRRHTTARGILFDLPHVIEGARQVLDGDVVSRCELVGGDFFKSVPGGADLYLVKYILHDWDEERSRAILATVHSAMPPSAKLLVIEDLVCGPNVTCDAKLGDVNMLARTGGRNRTEREYRELLRSGKFDVKRVFPATGDLAVLEAARL